ncbi:hypothetical protein G15_3411 [Enterococcus avium]|nr:hypothetical protein G15_3411 [Enterococcus avium]
MTSFYTYGTKPPMAENPGINVVRNFANDYLNGKQESVYITEHAANQMGKRKILTQKAVEIIANGYFVEYQDVKNKPGKTNCTVFYSGHIEKVLSVNTLADLGKNSITLVTVEHRNDEIWEEKGNYVERK